MSDVNPNNTRLINSPEELYPLYEGAGAAAKIGAEIELAFFDPETPDLHPMTPAQNEKLRNRIDPDIRRDIHNEPTSETLEAATLAAPFDELGRVIEDANAKMRAMRRAAESLGLKRSYFQTLPGRSAEDLLRRILRRDRYKAFFIPMHPDMDDLAAYFSVCKSSQVSISYRDPGHMLENVRRLYFLAPFLFMLTDNNSGFDQGRRFTGHAGIYHRKGLEERGPYFDYLFTARSGEDYIRAHIDHVMKNPLPAYYTAGGDMVRVKNNGYVSFNDLRERGLNTVSNYYFSESILWPDVKIAALRDQKANVTGHRYEARMFGVGLHQHISALLITGGLAFIEEFAQKTDRLLEEYGFSAKEPGGSKAHLDDAYKHAAAHGGKFLDIPYGTGGTMLDFARSFAELLEEAYRGSAREEVLTPILSICRSGETDTRVNTRMFPTLEKARDFQKSYDPAIWDNTQSCALDLFKNPDKALSTGTARA